MSDVSWACCDEEKVELFAHYFEGLFRKNDVQLSMNTTCLIGAKGRFKPILPLEIARNIDRLCIRKQSGHDQLTLIIFRELPKKGYMHIAVLINACFRLCPHHVENRQNVRNWTNLWKIWNHNDSFFFSQSSQRYLRK